MVNEEVDLAIVVVHEEVFAGGYLKIPQSLFFLGRGGNRGGGGFRDRSENNFQSNTDNDEPMKTFSGWPNVKPAAIPFESADQYTDNKIPSGTFEFALSHIEQCNDFFIQLYSKEKELLELNNTLQKEYQDAPELNLSSMKINQACLAKSSDDCWYRAVLLNTNLIKTQVRFIDFGDTIDLETRTIRQLAKKFSSLPPYAYRCTLNNVRSNENISTDELSSKCVGRQFHGLIEKKTSDERYFLQSDDFQRLMIDIKAIEKNLPCSIVYIDSDQHQFYIQDDSKTMEQIDEEVKVEIDLPPEDIQVNAMVISTFEDAPYRAVIQADLEENVRVYFVDYGNTNICSKISLKKCPEQLQKYPPQAKRCQLSDRSVNDLDQVYKQLDDYIESADVTYAIIHQVDDLHHVLLSINGECWNEKYDDQSSTITTATTVQERERPASASGKRNNDAILSPNGNSMSSSMNIKRQKNGSEPIELTSMAYREGMLVYIDQNKPMVYLQLIPESETILERIDGLVDTIVEENQRPSSYDIGEDVLAQFTKDNRHYRARIESYSTSTELYTVYFLDYGNMEENVRKEQLFSYSEQLKTIPAQAQGYHLDKITSSTWLNVLRPILEDKVDETMEFYFIDPTNSIIHLKLDDENRFYTQPKTFTANISGSYDDCFYIHILPDADVLVCEMDELLQAHAKEQQSNHIWKSNDLCIVFHSERNVHFRGRILSMNDEKYNVQCIDYGHVLFNITEENLYLLTDEDLIKREPLARQCRLYGVDEKEQFKAIEEMIRHINPMERVTITIDNDQNAPCMFVMLFRENNEIVNDRFIRVRYLSKSCEISYL